MVEWRKKTWRELADDANVGVQGQGNVVEAMRRQQKSQSWLSGIMIVLTLAILLLTGAIFYLTGKMLEQSSSTNQPNPATPAAKSPPESQPPDEIEFLPH